MAALSTVQDYVDRTRGLLQDTVAPYRYSDANIVDALDLAILEARRIRPDLMRSFFRSELPSYADQPLTTAVLIEPMYRPAFIYYMVGHIQMRDNEEVSDQRAAALLNKFTSQLLVVES